MAIQKDEDQISLGITFLQADIALCLWLAIEMKMDCWGRGYDGEDDACGGLGHLKVQQNGN